MSPALLQGPAVGGTNLPAYYEFLIKIRPCITQGPASKRNLTLPMSIFDMPQV